MVLGPGGSVVVVTAGTVVGAGEQPRVSVALSFAGTAAASAVGGPHQQPVGLALQ